MVAMLCFAAMAHLDESSPILRALKHRYAIAIDYPSAPNFSFGSVTFENLSAEDAKAMRSYSFVLASEINKYPPQFVRKANLRKIALVKKLSVEGVPVAASPEYKANILFLDIYGTGTTEAYKRRVIHHELYHLVEEELNGSAFYKDTKWSALNEPDFVYGTGGITSRSSEDTILNNPRRGFIDKYAMSGIEEDKAECFSVLFIAEPSRKCAEMAEKDDIVAAKIGAMKSAVRGWCPAMDENYWRDVVGR
jgi:hypothetical protein